MANRKVKSALLMDILVFKIYEYLKKRKFVSFWLSI